MKKVKIMMLSLILLAVVGGALAFKAKGPDSFCSIDALFYDNPSGPDFFYCEWSTNGLPTTVGGLQINTISCDQYISRGEVIGSGIPAKCTTVGAADTDDECQDVSCPAVANVVED